MTRLISDAEIGELEECREKSHKMFSYRETNPHSILREFEILAPGGGICFRSTSYGRMEYDSAWLTRCANSFPQLIDRLKSAEEALNLYAETGGQLSSAARAHFAKIEEAGIQIIVDPNMLEGEAELRGANGTKVRIKGIKE